jgi:hypothetical protein
MGERNESGRMKHETQSPATGPITEPLVYSEGTLPTEWIAIADRQPEPWDTEVLCWDAADQAHLSAHISGYREKGRIGPVWVADVEGQIFEPQQVTHWMPLPLAPRTGARR